MPGHTLSLGIPHAIKVDAIQYWPRKKIQGAQYININSNNNIIVAYNCPNTALIKPQIHLPAPSHEPSHHAQDYSLTISQGTTENCLCFYAIAGHLLRSVLHLLFGLAQVDLQMSFQGCAF